jgi:hypothetical protein
MLQIDDGDVTDTVDSVEKLGCFRHFICRDCTYLLEQC